MGFSASHSGSDSSTIYLDHGDNDRRNPMALNTAKRVGGNNAETPKHLSNATQTVVCVFTNQTYHRRLSDFIHLSMNS